MLAVLAVTDENKDNFEAVLAENEGNLSSQVLAQYESLVKQKAVKPISLTWFMIGGGIIVFLGILGTVLVIKAKQRAKRDS